jgi:hypothetical protein
MDRKKEVPVGKENYYVLPIVNWHEVRWFRGSPRVGLPWPAAMQVCSAEYALQLELS